MFNPMLFLLGVYLGVAGFLLTCYFCVRPVDDERPMTWGRIYRVALIISLWPVSLPMIMFYWDDHEFNDEE